jgi:hypothetical protein
LCRRHIEITPFDNSGSIFKKQLKKLLTAAIGTSPSAQYVLGTDPVSVGIEITPFENSGSDLF